MSSPGYISKTSFRRLSVNIHEIDPANRDSDDEFSDEEDVSAKIGDVAQDTKDTIVDTSDILTSLQRSSFVERV